MTNDENTHIRLAHTTFIQRENEFRHYSYDEELALFESLKNGDIEGVTSNFKGLTDENTGFLSKNKLRNTQYMFVAATTLATRFSIEAGLEGEVAYNLSDLYIQEMDQLKSIEDIKALHKKMLIDFTTRNHLIKKESAYTKPILLCMDYIYYHLNETITINSLSQYVHLSPSYLSTLFKKETSKTIAKFILEKRIETASNMLKFSEFTFEEIANYLAFSSQSHFISLFKKHTGFTPKQFRNQSFRQYWSKP